MRGIKAVLLVTVLFVVFHFAFHWTWRETLLAPTVLAVFFLALAVYELVTGKRRLEKMTQPE
jgi:hypothetical protein